jgi:hypothetical protein
LASVSSWNSTGAGGWRAEPGAPSAGLAIVVPEVELSLCRAAAGVPLSAASPRRTLARFSDCCWQANTHSPITTPANHARRAAILILIGISPSHSPLHQRAYVMPPPNERHND